MRTTTRNWATLGILLALLGLVTFQGYAYYFRLTLSLGPRVILQPWLLRQGYLLYEQIADEHSPLVSLLLAAAAPLLPGDGPSLAKWALVLLLSATTLLVFWAGRRYGGSRAGLLAALFFVCWSP